MPAGPINPIDAVLAEPQAVHRGLSMTIPDDLNGSLPGIASPLRLAATPPQANLPPPRLGAHSHEILQDLLSMSEARHRSASGRRNYRSATLTATALPELADLRRLDNHRPNTANNNQAANQHMHVRTFAKKSDGAKNG